MCNEESESRSDYLERYLAMPQKQWHELNNEERELLVEHISTSDFPSARDELEQMSFDAGFNQFESLYEDIEHSNIIVAMHK